MDPVTALQVAGVVVQFVDFGLKVVSKGRQIYRSGDGVLSEHHDLKLLTNDLVTLQAKLRCSIPASATDAKEQTPQSDLEALCATSENLATMLLDRLNMAKAQGQFRAWKSFRQALKSVWSKKAIDDMAGRLLKIRDELQFHVLIALKDQVDFQGTRQSERYQQLDQTTRSIFEAMCEGQAAISDLLCDQSALAKSRHDETHVLLANTSAKIIASMDSAVEQFNSAVPDSGVLRRHTVDSSDIEESILNALRFTALNDRDDAVTEAHAKTFAWIFDRAEGQPWDDFFEWLKSPRDMYWITGKAASGKSTLMKFIQSHDHLLDRALSDWAGKRVIRASFFFWNTGSVLQKSQAGLLRTLLLKVLWVRREIINLLFPDLWEERIQILSGMTPREQSRFQFPEYAWTVKQLLGAFDSLLERIPKDVNLCFFVDGLDEFEGDHREIASLVKKVSAHPKVKVCVSSRPLMVFEQEFEAYPSLRLQDLTHNDMLIYVRDNLYTHRRMEDLYSRSAQEVDQLIQEIVTMSSGVFLWITLAVKSLLEGLTNYDSTDDLRRRLRDLPPELDELFSHMLASIKPKFYIPQASRLFQIVYHALSPLSVLALSYADDEDPEQAVKMQMRDLARNIEATRVQAMSARIKTRCAGLLEVRGVSDYSIDNEDQPAGLKRATKGYGGARRLEVHYLHLTVREFLEKPTVWTMLLDCTRGTGFDANAALLRSNVMMLKSSIRRFDHETRDHVAQTMQYAAWAENSLCVPQVALMDDMDKTVGRIFTQDTSQTDTQRHWAYVIHQGTSRSKCSACPQAFLTFAMMHGLALYVKSKINSDQRLLRWPEGKRTDRPILEYATLCRPTCAPTVLLQPSLLAAVLESGADPNERFRGSTPWQTVLSTLYNYYKRAELNKVGPEWVDVCKLYVLYGANPREEIRDPVGNHQLEDARRNLALRYPTTDLRHHNAEYRTLEVLDVVGKVFAHLKPGPVEDLRVLLLQSGARPPQIAEHRPRKRKANDGQKLSRRPKKPYKSWADVHPR